MTPAPALETPAPPARPTVVTVAVWFQAALVVLLLLIVAVMIADAIHYDGLIDQAARLAGAPSSEVTAERDSNLGFSLVFGLPVVVLLLWLAVTLVGVRRGSNVARILTWVGLGAPVGLLLLACLFGGLVGFVGLLAFGMADESDPGEFEAEDFPSYEAGGFYDRLYDLDSGGWSLAFDAIRAVALALAVLLVIAVAVLLLTGPADRFFRPDRRRRPSPYAVMWPGHPAGAPFHPAGPPGYAHPVPPPQAMPPQAMWGPPVPPQAWWPPAPPMWGRPPQGMWGPPAPPMWGPPPQGMWGPPAPPSPPPGEDARGEDPPGASPDQKPPSQG